MRVLPVATSSEKNGSPSHTNYALPQYKVIKRNNSPKYPNEYAKKSGVVETTELPVLLDRAE